MGFYGSWVYFDGGKGRETMDKVTGTTDFPLAECLRLHSGTLCWYQALFEGIVEIANAACTPQRARLARSFISPVFPM